ncbi:MAG: cell filamentation protein Fic, partial [Bacteroidota bacterium]|nr:cell filamentation protein Fic [Bacteroidota bacterium]
MNDKGEILLYKNDKGNIKLEVNIQDETVWLNRNQISLLFNRDVKTIGKHINNIFTEGELVK